MASSNCTVRVTEAPLTASPPGFSLEAGAVVDFWGVVRAQEGNAAICGLNYEAHLAMAESKLADIARRMMADNAQVQSVEVHHRIGFVSAGEPSLFVRIFAKHREPAFEAARELVNELKRIVPIWKNPVSAEKTREI